MSLKIQRRKCASFKLNMMHNLTFLDGCLKKMPPKQPFLVDKLTIACANLVGTHVIAFI